MTLKEKVIATAYTGILFGDSDVYMEFWKYAEKLTGETIINHEFASRELWDRIKELSKDDFEKMINGEYADGPGK